MGFSDVYELIGGRATWTTSGLPTEGQIGDARRIGRHVLDAPSVAVDATIGDAAALDDVAYTVAVLGCDGVVVGALRPASLALPPQTPVSDVMIPAPSTIRPDLRVEEVAQRLAKDGLDHVLVTTVNGVLIGLVTTKDLHV